MHHKVHFCTHTFLFWTSSVLTPPQRPIRHAVTFLFGLHPFLTPLQRPIRHALTSFLDFSVPFLRFNVQSTTLWLPFWTSPCHSSASTSNPPHFDFLFGLHPCLTPLQRPICHSLTSFLDFFRASLHLNVQSATLQFHATLCITFPPHSPSSFEYSILEH